MEEDLTELDRRVREWMANPHAFFKAFSRTARRFQHEHRSARLRVMTFVGGAEDFLPKRPVRVHLLDRTIPVTSWEQVLSAIVGVVVTAYPVFIVELSRAGLLPWMVNGEPSVDLLEAFRRGKVTLSLPSRAEAIRCTQWLLLMAGVRLNEAVVQVDPFTDEQWKAREAELQAKHQEEKRVLREIDQARKRYAAAHSDESGSGVAGGPETAPSEDGYVF